LRPGLAAARNLGYGYRMSSLLSLSPPGARTLPLSAIALALGLLLLRLART
jgi:hypothetical protein